MEIEIFQVDAFTRTPFKGNPAGVCPQGRGLSEGQMQAVAAEMNLSETAFLFPGDGEARAIRYFTPTVEVPLCGHATLASAHVLWESGALAAETPAVFTAGDERLTARRTEDGRICMDFPQIEARPMLEPAGLAAALGAPVQALGCFAEGGYLVELASEEAVQTLAPDIPALLARGFGEVIVTSAADDPQVDFVSRFFAPAYGIDEDPVTGYAHCCLGPYWAERLGLERMIGRQLSARTGSVEVCLRPGGRIDLLGAAVTVLRGVMTI